MPDNNAAAQRVMGNAKAFKALGYDTYFVGLSRTNKSCDVEGKYEGFHFINLRYPKSPKDWISYLFLIKEYRKFLEKKPDIIIAYNFPAIALNNLRKWCNKKNTPIIADCTEWYEAKGNIVFRLIKSFDNWYRMNKVHFKMDGMIAISDYLYDFYSPKMENVINVPPLVDLSMDKWSLNLNNNEESNFVNIVFAGTFGNGKERFDKVLEILSQIKAEKDNKVSFILNIIGETRIQYLKIFSTEIPYNLQENLLFKGRLSHEETLNEIKQAHFSLFLREKNLVNIAGFPTKFIESISAGTPVLTNSTSNIEKYLEIGKFGYILNTESNKSLKYDLKKALNQPIENINKMKQVCYNSKQFNYKNYISLFDCLINNL